MNRAYVGLLKEDHFVKEDDHFNDLTFGLIRMSIFHLLSCDILITVILLGIE